MRKSFVLLLAFFLAFSNFSIGQEEDINSLFDDGSISNPKSLIKFNLASAIAGDIAVSYEYVFSDVYGLEGGFGMINHYFEYPFSLRDEFEFENIIGGYSIRILGKKYIQEKAPDYNYWGPMLRFRTYNFEHKDVTCTDFMLVFGVQLPFGKRFFLDYIIGIGWRKVKETFSSGTVNRFNRIVFPLNLSLGIGF